MTKSIVFLLPNSIVQKTGGVELQTSRMAQSLLHKGWRVTFIVSVSNPADAVDVSDGIRYLWVRRSRYFDLLRIDILKLIYQVKPDILYQRGRSNLTASLIATLLSLRPYPKLVYHIAEDSDMDPHIWVALIGNPPHGIHYPFLRALAWMKAFNYRSTIRRSHLRLCQTQFQMSRCAKVIGKPSALVYSTIEITPLSIPKDDPPVVLWVAHAGRRKQLEIFIELARKLRAEQAQFVIGGTIPDPRYRADLERQMEGLDNLIYVGPLTWEQSQSWFARSSIYVNTTLKGREGFPNTYLQAWVHGTPVVTLHCDPDDLLENKSMGFHSKSVDRMVDQIRLLLHSKEARQSMGMTARQYVTQHHNVADLGQKLDTLFTPLLKPTSKA